MEWQQFVMNLETLSPASVEEVLVRHGATSVTFSDAGDVPVLEPGPGETPLWNNTRITGLFQESVKIATRGYLKPVQVRKLLARRDKLLKSHLAE